MTRLTLLVVFVELFSTVRNGVRSIESKQGLKGEMGTHVELIILGGLNGPVFGKALDDLDGLFELGLGHDE